MAILNNNPLVGASGNQGGYNISNSLRFRSSASAKLTRTPASSSNRKTWTWSGWVKLGAAITSGNGGIFGVTGSGDSELFSFRFESNTIKVAGNFTLWLQTTQVFRDPSAWYHIVLSVDTTQTTSSNRFKLYINGNQVTALSTANYPSQNADLGINRAVQHNIYADYDGTNYLDGYLADVNFIDGQALTPSSFGETDTITGVWKPKAYSGTYGTNGFYLKFSDIATTSGSNAGLGKDFSGNSNYWTTNNISVTAGTTYDAMTDSPTNTSATVANYAVLNPLLSTSYQTLSNANLTSTNNTSADNGNTYSSIPTGFSGKWYCEFKTINASSGYPTVGTRDVAITTRPINGAYGSIGGDPIGGSSGSVGYRANGDKSINGNATAYGSSYTDSDTIGIAVDADNGAIYFSKNGTWQNSGDPTSGATKTGAANTWTGGSQSFYIGASIYPSGNGVHFNFGQRPFSYTPPTGFVRLNTYNLPDSTIKKGNTVMDATLYTADTAGGKTITNSGSMQPDLVWIKNRDNAENHYLMDAVRGAGTNKYLQSNTTSAETSAAFGDALVTPVSNGFSITDSNYNAGEIYFNGRTYVAWQWKANGAGSSNTSGSITSTVSVNTTAGFSVVTYTGNGTSGATVGHGLGVAPSLILPKVRSRSGDNWHCYHRSLGATQGIILNLTNAATTDSGFWNNTNPTSTVFTVGTYNTFSSQTYVAYCWAEIAGFSRFTSYTGNGSSDGPFIATNFAPKFVMIKQTNTTGDWQIFDTSRSPTNVASNTLYANGSFAEDSNVTNRSVDFLSNGFKIRSSGTFINASGGTFIVAAWAENPFKNSLAR